MWTSEPQVFPSEYPEFGLHGRGGRLYSWYGIGQSLLMLPADVAGTWISRWPMFAGYGDDPGVRSIVVSYSTSILLNVLTALVSFRLLRQLRFSVREAVLGVLALMFCTTHLHYTQNLMENNYILLLSLTGFSFQYDWLRTGSKRALLMGCAAFGLNLLTRVTTGLDLMAGGVFLLLVLRFERVRGQELWPRLVTYCKIAAPVYLFFLMVDRLYQFFRFDRYQHLYIGVRQGAAFDRSDARGQFSVDQSFPQRLSRSSVQAGEVDFSIRPSAGAGDSLAVGVVEAVVAGSPRI